jgi:hypothetical protein
MKPMTMQSLMLGETITKQVKPILASSFPLYEHLFNLFSTTGQLCERMRELAGPDVL